MAEPATDAPGGTPQTPQAQRRLRSLSAGAERLARRGAAFSARYSIAVQFMKVVLPATAVALVGVVIAWPQISSDTSRFVLGSGTLAAPDIDQLKMIKARFLGIDSNDQPYVVTADTATQSTGGDRLLLLEEPKADLTTKDGAWVAMQSALGTYDQQKETVHLTGGVNIFHDLGYELVTETATLDLKAGRAVSIVPVSGQGPAGTIASQGMIVEDKGARILFTGKSRLVLTDNPAPGSSVSRPGG